MDTPGPNPSTNPENQLYAEWQEASQEDRPKVEASLLPLLRNHAARVCWMVLHSSEPDYVEEVAQDALMQLCEFENRSLFSTWFHARALNRFRVLLRQRRQRKELSIDVLEKQPAFQDSSQLHSHVLVEKIMQEASEDERTLLRMKFDEGLSEREIADKLKINQSSVQERWKWLRKRLKTRYGAAE